MGDSMNGELGVLLFLGNVALFWLWSSHLLPLLRASLRDVREPCPHCGH